jgi:hypothetical protein
MGYLITQGDGLTTFKTTFTGLEIQTMGSAPLQLNPIVNDINGRFFLPIFFGIKKTNVTTPFDFNGPDHPIITEGIGGNAIAVSITLLQTLQNDRFFCGTFINGTSGGSSRTNITTTLDDANYYLTTINGADATQGDSIVTVYLSGFYITL